MTLELISPKSPALSNSYITSEMYTDRHEVELTVFVLHSVFNGWFRELDTKSEAFNVQAPSLFRFLTLESHSTGSNQSTNASVQLHESTGSGHLVVCAGSLRFSLHHNVCGGTVLTI